LLNALLYLAAIAVPNHGDAPDSLLSHVRDQQTSVVVTVDSVGPSIHDQFEQAFTPGAINVYAALDPNILNP
jgi:hypothetical protein